MVPGFPVLIWGLGVLSVLGLLMGLFDIIKSNKKLNIAFGYVSCFLSTVFVQTLGFAGAAVKTGSFNCFGSGREVRQLNVPVRVWCICAVGLPREGRMSCVAPAGSGNSVGYGAMVPNGRLLCVGGDLKTEMSNNIKLR